MMLSKSSNCLRISKEIQIGGVPAPFLCDFCASCGLNCFVMESQPKCDKCTHRGCLCVGVSWESLNRTRLSLRKEISKAMKEMSKANDALAAKHTELAALSLKVIHLQKTLDQADHCALQKANCLAAELGSNNDGMGDEIDPMSQLVDSMLPSFWDSLLVPPQNIKASSHSS